MSKIAVIGAGYVGLITAGGLAKLGHSVTCLEVDPQKLAALKAGCLPVREPCLDALWESCWRRGSLRVTGDYAEGLPGSDFVFLCVGTPRGRNGSVDLLHLVSAVTRAMRSLQPNERPTFVVKSTVPVRTAELVEAILSHFRAPAERPPVVSNPEFLREGQALDDFLHPVRVIIGSADETAARQVAELYAPLKAPTVFCGSRTAELVKYASNAFLATKISFINEIAELCESYDADVTKVAETLGLDPDVGSDYLVAGLGWGGSCLPKDLAALIRMASVQQASNSLLTAVLKVNTRQPRLIVSKLRRLLGHLDRRTVAVWGLTFKPDCDDMRNSPALRLIQLLRRQGCRVNAYNPMANLVTGSRHSAVAMCADPYAAASGADAIVLATAWPVFQGLDFQRLRELVHEPLLVDARNCLPIEEVERAGFTYVGVGQGSVPPGAKTGDPPGRGQTADHVGVSLPEAVGRARASSHGTAYPSRRISVVGAGYVGLTAAACLAKLGHDVICLDVDLQKVADIKANRLPIKEPHLNALWRHYQRRSTLRVTADYAEAVRGRDFIFFCVGTPAGRNGSVNLRYLHSAVSGTMESLGPEERPVFVMKSTVPMGTAEQITALAQRYRPHGELPAVVSNPEYLREGQTVQDFLKPPCVVIGSADEAAANQVAELYAPLKAPIVFCSSRSAELAKYASNAFLAMKISFINEIAELCESYSVDVTKVSEVLGMDPRIRRAYLGAGLGWGGSCFPKDLAALTRMAAAQDVPGRLVAAVRRVNDRQPRLVIAKLRRLLGSLSGRPVAVWGLAFKPNCDDTRDSPALKLIQLLQRQGCRVKAYDPVAILPPGGRYSSVTVCADAYEAASRVDAVVVATAWPEFRGLDFRRLRRLVRQPLLVDARNCLALEEVEKAGFTYLSLGRARLVPEAWPPVIEAAEDAASRRAGYRGPAISDLAAAVMREPIRVELP